MARESLHKLVETFIETIAQTKKASAHTRSAYKLDLERFFTFWEQLETAKQQSWPLERTVQSYKRNLVSKKVASSTIARKMSCFNSFFAFALPHDPNRPQCKRPPVPDKKLETLSTQDIQYLLDIVPTETLPTNTPQRDRAVFELLYATGMRCSELVNIRLADVSFEERSITIARTNSAPRTVFFGPKAAEQLQHYVTIERPPMTDRLEHLLVKQNRAPITVRTIQRVCEMFGTLIKKPITPAILRNTFATHLLQNGTRISTVQKLMGHRTPASTERYLR